MAFSSTALMAISEGGDTLLDGASGATGSLATSDLAGTMKAIGDVVSGLLNNVIAPIMSFMLSTPLCVVGLGLTFCGAGFGFVRRAVKSSRT